MLVSRDAPQNGLGTPSVVGGGEGEEKKEEWKGGDAVDIVIGVE